MLPCSWIREPEAVGAEKQTVREAAVKKKVQETMESTVTDSETGS